MAIDKSAEIARDLARLERALERIDAIIAAKAPKESDPTFIAALDGAQLKAIDRIVPLLARKATLLGLDAPEPKPAGAQQSGTLAELEQKIALVNKLS